MTIAAINFPGPDSHEAPTTLRAALVNSLSLLGSFPKTGLLLKVINAGAEEQIVHWGLVDPGSLVPEALKEALASPPVVRLATFPTTGLILKVKEDESGERLVNWMLADPSKIEMLAIGLSVNPPAP